MPVQNLGKVIPTYKGVWHQNTHYYKLDIVTYDGEAYFALTDSLGSAPSAFELEWGKIAAKGGQGPEGPEGPAGPEGPSGQGTTTWDTITGKPAEFPPADHNANKITSGFISEARIPNGITRDTELAMYVRLSEVKYTDWHSLSQVDWEVPANSIVVNKETRIVRTSSTEFRIAYRTIL